MQYGNWDYTLDPCTPLSGDQNAWKAYEEEELDKENRIILKKLEKPETTDELQN